jgi:hypothetical protein
MYIPDRPLEKDEEFYFPTDRIESARVISEKQMAGSRVTSSREEYIKSLPKDIEYMELGVAWGYYSNLVCQIANPKSTVLLDPFDQDLRCWSWKATGSCKCDPKHEMLYLESNHEEWITQEFSKYRDVSVIKGHAPKDLPKDRTFDYIYVDTHNDRYHIRSVANAASKLVKVGGILGFNDYVIYDGIIEDVPYGTYQAINEFLYFNQAWSVDAIALHPCGFHDIYLRRNA